MTLQRLFWPLITLILACTAFLQVRSALGETQTWDEGIHITAGYSYLTTGDYSWNPEHPPLVKIMSALPLRFMGLEAHPYGPDGKRQNQVRYGVDFLYHNRRHADTILMAARTPTILLTLLFTAAFAWWMQRRFGIAAALLATVLCAFDPNLIAHGRYVTTDVPLTAFYFFSCALWVEYLERGGARRLLAAAIAIAIAMVVKFSAILLFPPLTLLYAIRWVQRPADFPVRRALLAAVTVLGVLVLAIVAAYWPETVRFYKTGGASSAYLGVNPIDPSPVSVVARALHIQGHAYIIGLNDVVSHNEGGHASYLLGARSDKGWWYYFPVVFAVKSTVATLAAALLLFCTGLWIAVRGLSRRLLACLRAIPLVTLGLLLPPLFYFGSSMTSGINLGMRHILPIYPFLYAGVAVVLARACSIAMTRRIAPYAMILLGTVQVAECAGITPDYLAFFNTLAGGPGRGPEYLVDSNIDWGQDVKKLVHWLDAHGTRRVRIFYFGNAQMPYYGVGEVGYPAPLDLEGWDEIDDYCAASVTPLYGVYAPLGSLARLRMREPIAKIGWSIYVYDLRKKKTASSPW